MFAAKTTRAADTAKGSAKAAQKTPSTAAFTEPASKAETRGPTIEGRPGVPWSFGRLPISNPRRTEKLPEEVRVEGLEELPASVSGALRSPGHGLDRMTADEMERQFGIDFSRVLIHTDDHAVGSARELKAAAYTVGPDIVFGRGMYRPGTRRGRELLAHELAHVAQQQAHPAPNAGPLLSRSSDAAEMQADDVVQRMRRGLSAGLVSSAAPSARLHLAPETWYRGYVEGEPSSADAATSGQRGFVHDLGSGVYFTDTESVAKEYADMRVADAAAKGGSGPPPVGSVAQGVLDPSSLGTTLDLTKEPKFMEFYNKVAATGPVSGERYRNLVDGYLKGKGTTVDSYAVLLGPEGVRGGRQMRIKDVAVADRVIAGWKAAAAKVKPGGGGPKGDGGGGEAPAAPKTAPQRPRTGKAPREPEGEPEAPKGRRTGGASDFEGGAPSLGRNLAITAGVLIFTAVKTYLIGKSLDDALAKEQAFKSADKTKTVDLMRDFANDAKVAPMRLLDSDIESYAMSGFSGERLNAEFSFVKRAFQLNGIKDDATRMATLNLLRLDVVNDIGELNRANDVWDKALLTEPDILRRKKAAEDLKAIIENPIVAEKLITEEGVSVEAWSAIVSNLANYIAVHQAVLDSLHSLKKQVAEHIVKTNNILRLLNEAAEKNAHTG